METSIKINIRNKGFFHHKTPRGLNVTEAKSYALKDISDYIRNGNTDFGERNYISIEPEVLKMPKNEEIFVNEDCLNNLPFIHNKEISFYTKKTFKKNSINLENVIVKKSSEETHLKWVDFCNILRGNAVAYIFYNKNIVYKHELFWSGVNPHDIIERKKGYDWKYWNYNFK